MNTPLTRSLALLTALAGLLAPSAARADLQFRPSGEHAVRVTLVTGTNMPAPNPAFVDQKWSSPALTVKSGQTKSRAKVGNLRVTVTINPLLVRVEDSDRRVIQELTFSEENGSFTFPVGDAPVLGLGEGGDQFDRRGANYRVINGQRDRLAELGTRIFTPFVIGTKGWALLVGTPYGGFDLRTERGSFTPIQGSPVAGTDVVVIDSKEPAFAMAEFARLTGPAVMPPKWSLGYMQSHRTLSNEADIFMEAKLFRERNLPCDTFIYLGTGFCSNGWNYNHDSFELNSRVFPRSAADTLKDFHDMNYHVAVHIVPQTPGQNAASLYPSMHGTIPPTPDEKVDNLSISSYWKRHLELFNAGMDAWWPDEGDWLDVPSRLARHRLYYQGPLNDKPNVRPWDLQRNGYMGIAQYGGGWHWSGDIQSTWKTFAAQVKVGQNSVLSVSPYWGTDTGGFYPANTREYTGELYLRWFQFSTFCPSFRSHGRIWRLHSPWGWNIGDPGPIESRPAPPDSELHNAEVEPICRDYLNLRYQLMPYTYTLAREATDTGMPLMRALWLHYPDDAQAVKRGDEYMWGRDILVAPVTEPGATKRELYLPKGVWYDWWNNQKAPGGGVISQPVDLKTMPIYVRAGAIIPFDPVRQYTAQPVTDPTSIRVYRGANGKYVLYDDDGISLNYQKDGGTWTSFTWNDSGKKLEIRRDSRSRATAAKREFDVVLLPDNVHKKITFDGKSADVKF